MKESQPKGYEQFEVGGLTYKLATRKMLKKIKEMNPDLTLCLGDSVTQEVKLLKKKGLEVKHLPAREGNKLYEKGTVEQQKKALLEITSGSDNVLVVEDTIVSGGKLYQLKNTFVYTGIPFSVLVLAAESEIEDKDISLISTNPLLIKKLRERADQIRQLRRKLE